jgi:signal transduction histidine kinase
MFEFTGLPEQNNYILNDKDRIQQILVNLIGNSLKYTKSGGSV